MKHSNIDKIKARVEKLREARKNATIGEWEYDSCGDVFTLAPIAKRLFNARNRPDDDTPNIIGSTSYWVENNPNAQFIALAANETEWLCESLILAVEALDEIERFGLRECICDSESSRALQRIAEKENEK